MLKGTIASIRELRKGCDSMTEPTKGTTNKLRKNEGLNMRYSIIIGLVIALLIFWLTPTKSIVNMKNAISPGASSDSSMEVIQMQTEEISVPKPPVKPVDIDNPTDKGDDTIGDTTTPPLTTDPTIVDDQPEWRFYDEAPEVLKPAPVPVYPEMAMKSNTTGKVTVSVLIGADGIPIKAVILKSDNVMFEKPAYDAAMKTKFKPAKANNKPVSVWFALIYTFKLD